MLILTDEALSDARTEPASIVEAFSGLNSRAMLILRMGGDAPAEPIKIQDGKLVLRSFLGGALREAVYFNVLMADGQEIVLLALKNGTNDWLPDSAWTDQEIMAIYPPRNAGPIRSMRPDPYPHLLG